MGQQASRLWMRDAVTSEKNQVPSFAAELGCGCATAVET
jgi:hypothetical protein